MVGRGEEQVGLTRVKREGEREMKKREKRLTDSEELK